jgi:hypothetical protein
MSFGGKASTIMTMNQSESKFVRVGLVWFQEGCDVSYVELFSQNLTIVRKLPLSLIDPCLITPQIGDLCSNTYISCISSRAYLILFSTE